jgi:hypothetical protein
MALRRGESRKEGERGKNPEKSDYDSSNCC